MRKITSTTELREAIFLLETKQANEARLLKEQFMITYESFKPVNLIKNSINELITSPQLKGNILNTTIGLAAGYLSKRVAVGSTHNPLKQLLGTFLQFGVTNIVSKNTDGIKSTVMSLISNFLNKNRSTD
ncbi:MAG: hypothetical protein A3F72_14300 [Bacteroidetes bacterium RIFCSPLOWO2_12_FULL_35_15]|nr:MAG: hypothetical protein A3F72_14300 [Bacteroidetes bacterium RIFCSPLOWO2_12_FULL_35_15]